MKLGIRRFLIPHPFASALCTPKLSSPTLNSCSPPKAKPKTPENGLNYDFKFLFNVTMVFQPPTFGAPRVPAAFSHSSQP